MLGSSYRVAILRFIIPIQYYWCECCSPLTNLSRKITLSLKKKKKKKTYSSFEPAPDQSMFKFTLFYLSSFFFCPVASLLKLCALSGKMQSNTQIKGSNPRVARISCLSLISCAGRDTRIHI